MSSFQKNDLLNRCASTLDSEATGFFSPRFPNFSATSADLIIMALKIRLQRHGATHRPFYRMVVTEASARRDGRFVEVLGTYEPQASKPENELDVKLDRVDYWKSVGAKETDTAASLIRKARRDSDAEEQPVVTEAAKTEDPAAETVAVAEEPADKASEEVASSEEKTEE